MNLIKPDNAHACIQLRFPPPRSAQEKLRSRQITNLSFNKTPFSSPSPSLLSHIHRTTSPRSNTMPKTIFTTITPLPAGVSRQTVLETLHHHLEMIDLNPAHTERHRINPPPEATPEEYHCTWYQITDKISYFPGYKGKVSFNACFHDLANGLQNHVLAPMGLDIKEKWTVGGNMPGEPVVPAEIGIGAPISGLYLREDVESEYSFQLNRHVLSTDFLGLVKCNFLMARFVRKTLKDALATLVARLVVKAQLQEAAESNRRLEYGYNSPPGSPPLSPPSTAGFDSQFPRWKQNRMSTQTAISEMEGSQKSPVFGRSESGKQHPVELRSDNGKYKQQAPVELPS